MLESGLGPHSTAENVLFHAPIDVVQPFNFQSFYGTYFSYLRVYIGFVLLTGCRICELDTVYNKLV